MKRFITSIFFLLSWSLASHAGSSSNGIVSLESYLTKLNDLNFVSSELHRETLDSVQLDFNISEASSISQHIQAYYGRAREQSSYRRDGRIIDCFKVNQQPALLKADGSYVALESPPDNRHTTKSFFRQDKSQCKNDEIGIPRLDLVTISRFKTLNNFLKKYPTGGSQADTSLTDGVTHYYAVGRKSAIDHASGSQSYLNVWQPTTATNMMSLSQLWVATGDGSTRQTIESGWQVYPRKYSSILPAVFIYYTPDNYTSGCYNLDCKAFVTVSDDVPIGQALPSSMISQPDGAQKEILLQWTLNPLTNSWWLWYEGGGIKDWAGYYPKEVFKTGDLPNGASRLTYGGEDAGNPNALQIGSGQFPVQGYGKAAYQRMIRYRPKGSSSWQPVDLSEIQPTPACYKAEATNSTTSDWWSFIYFGGPKCPNP